MNIFNSMDNPKVMERYANIVGGRYAPPSALISTKYLDKVCDHFTRLKARGILAKLFLDTETFARNQEGKGPSDDHEFRIYMDRISRVGSNFDLIAAYDVDFKNPERNQDFYCQMLDELTGTGLEKRIVPVIHDSVNAAEEFELYADMGATVIAIGSTPPISSEQWALINRLRFEREIDVHIFGNLGAKLLKDKQPESADSARFAHDAKYGDICVWNPRTENLERIHVTSADEYTDEIRDFIMSTFGFTPADLMADVTNKWMVNLYGIHQMQDFLTNTWYPQNEVKDW